MRILFICGSLEPGRDGVGDYTRTLAAAIVGHGHEVRLLAINDRHVNVEWESIEEFPGGKIRVLRLPFALSWARRGERARDWLRGFESDWASLQFVPYSFQRKGLPVGLGDWLRGCIECRHWHIMFHETWLGFTKESLWWHWPVGWLQRELVGNLVRSLDVQCVTTSNKLYVRMLGSMRLNAVICPVFSSIPVCDRNESFFDWLMTRADMGNGEREDWMMVGFFGSIDFSVNYEQLLDLLSQRAAFLKKKIAILGFGRCANVGRFMTLFNGRSTVALVKHLGEVSSETISQLLQLLDFGVSSTPSRLLGKSSAFSAMKLHGVPVWVSADGTAWYLTPGRGAAGSDPLYFPEASAKQLLAQFEKVDMQVSADLFCTI